MSPLFLRCLCQLLRIRTVANIISHEETEVHRYDPAGCQSVIGRYEKQSEVGYSTNTQANQMAMCIVL